LSSHSTFSTALTSVCLPAISA